MSIYERVGRWISYPVAFERLDAAATLRGGLRDSARGAELPHLDSLVETAADEVATIGRECDRVHAVLVTVGSLETLHQETASNLPDAHALVERSSRHILGIGRDGHRGDAILNAQRQDVG
jgi:hypothetical protein